MSKRSVSSLERMVKSRDRKIEKLEREIEALEARLAEIAQRSQISTITIRETPTPAPQPLLWTQPQPVITQENDADLPAGNVMQELSDMNDQPLLDSGLGG